MSAGKFQIAVVGGGPAGAVVAQLLAAVGKRVALIERGRKRDFKAGETLPPVANPLLRRLGLWPLLEAEHIRCPGNQSAFGSVDLVDLDFIRSAHGAGWHLNRLAFEDALRARAQASGAVVIPKALTGLTQQNGDWCIHLSDDTQIRADFIVDASGAGRSVLRKLDVPEMRYDQLAACAGVYTCVTQQDHRTLIEAAQDGWWYSAGLPQGQRVVMYFSDTDSDSFGQVRADFDSQLAETKFVAECLHRSTPTGLPKMFVEPSYSAHAAQVAGQGWLALGDAAMRFDPLSSQGLWTAMMSAEKAALAILGGSEQDLHGYAAWCEATFNSYLDERSKYYALETRWPGRSFWQRRMGHDSNASQPLRPENAA